MTRTAAEVGTLVKERREALGIRQEAIEGVSSSLVRQIEQGRAPKDGRGITRAALTTALRWPANAIERLYAGEDPATWESHAGEDRLRSLRDQLQSAADQLTGLLGDDDALVGG